MRPHPGVYNVMARGLASHMLVSVHLLCRHLNATLSQKNSGHTEIQWLFKYIPISLIINNGLRMA